jgi:hypothetical protein
MTVRPSSLCGDLRIFRDVDFARHSCTYRETPTPKLLIDIVQGEHVADLVQGEHLRDCLRSG